MNAKDLPGLTVMVHPLLANDPAGRAGQIGNIITADHRQDEYLVNFADDMQARYSADALQVLQPFEKLYGLIENRDQNMSPDTYKDLLSITLLQRYGSAQQIRTAFKLVQQHEQLQKYALLSLEEALVENRSPQVGR